MFAFPSKAFVIGSGETCQVRLPRELVEPQHAEFLRDERGQWWVRDVVSSGSVSLNGVVVTDERLAVGDVLQIGRAVLAVRDSGVSASARTSSGDSNTAVTAGADLPPDLVIDGRYRIITARCRGRWSG